MGREELASKSAMNAATAQNGLETDLQFGPPGSARVTLLGRLNAQTTVPCWNRLEQELRGAKLEKLEVDASGLRVCDGAGLALLRYLSMGRMTPGASVLVSGLETGLEQIFRAFTREDYEAFRPPVRTKCHPLSEEVGLQNREIERRGDHKNEGSLLQKSLDES